MESYTCVTFGFNNITYIKAETREEALAKYRAMYPNATKTFQHDCVPSDDEDEELELMMARDPDDSLEAWERGYDEEF